MLMPNCKRMKREVQLNLSNRHNQDTKHHSKLTAIKYGISFALHLDIDIPRKMKGKKKTEQNKIMQETVRIKHI